MSRTGTDIVTVSEYASAVGRALRAVGGAVVEGEAQRPRVTPSGMLCFDLTDGEAKLACKVFRQQAARLEHTPEHGDLIRAEVDRPDLWAAAGKLDLIVSAVRLAGEGELLRRRAQLLARLEAEGLCDPARRRPIPEFPRAVGVIAGRGSDGLSDVVQALRDRFPPVHVVTCPAVVQGQAAPRDMIDALAHLQEHPLVDVIVLARGGGSVQDLVAFDDERLCRAIFACAKPVVAAIGHTENVPVCNHVTWSATTPSRSAEMVVPSAVVLRQAIELSRQALGAAPARLDARSGGVERARTALAAVRRRPPAVDGALTAGRALDVRAAAFFGERRGALARAREPLAGAAARIARTASETSGASRRLCAGTLRQSADHQRDYRHALARLVREAGAGAGRALDRPPEALARAAGLARERAAHRVADSARDLRHAATVVEARDFRRHGFVLAADEAGRPVRSVSGLDAGRRLRLNFSDGVAGAVVDAIHRAKQEGRR